MKQIDLYYSRVCGLCTKAIDFFHSRGVTFTAYAVEYDAEADAFVDSDNTREMYRRCGEKVEFVPQIFIGGQVIGGCNELFTANDNGTLQRLLDQHEVDYDKEKRVVGADFLPNWVKK